MSALQTRLAGAGVNMLLVQFTDLLGVAKGKLVPLAHVDTVLATGAGFAGPSIVGTGLPRSGPRSEFYARGDAGTAVPLPWYPGVARIVGDGFVDNAPFEACPRQVLRRARERLAALGLTLQLGIEPEFFLLRRGEGGTWQPADEHDRLDKPSYDLKSLARQQGLLQDLAAALQACGLDVQQIDHEDAHGQYELNFKHAEALVSCDNLMLFKLAAHALAEQRGLVFSMMPKPFAGQPGSGLHFHGSLWRGETPAEGVARHFIAGVLAHAPALCALAAPTVNSYRRLAAGRSISGTTWAPVWIAHGPNNRSALVRTLPGRFEWRVPDASANPYLAAAGLIAAGIDGIERKLEPPPAITDDLFEWSADRLATLPRLPRDLNEALDALEADAVITAALGPVARAQFLHLKREEWAQWVDGQQQVTPWELARYAATF